MTRSVLSFAMALTTFLAWGSGGPGALALDLGPGIFAIMGQDAQLGAYEGELEIRENAEGELRVRRVVGLLDRAHDDGRAIDLVWTGTVRGRDGDAPSLSFSLARAGFINAVDDLVRTEADARPLGVVGTVSEGADGGIEIIYGAPEDPAFAARETAVALGPPERRPIFRSERKTRATHPAPGVVTKLALFRLFGSYHELPEVAPFTRDPRFRRAIHRQVTERTDFRYYRANPDRLRVVDKVVDAISLAETEIRANAFRARLHDKAAFYQQGLSEEFLAAHGMVVRSIGGRGRATADFSAALWTGIYAFTQALRHQATGEEAALDDLRRALGGIFTLIDISGDPRTFARSLRPAGPPLTGSWRRGTGDFARLDWLEGGNNDMGKGLLLAMIAGWQALPTDDPLRQAIPGHALALLDLCVFMAEPPGECGGENSSIPVLGIGIPTPDLDLPSLNPGAARLLAGLTNGDQALVESGLSWLRQPVLLQSAAQGGGPIQAYGISDWSGNHLTLTSTLILQRLLAETDDRELEDLWIGASGEAWQLLRRFEHPLHAALAVASGALDRTSDDRRVARKKAIWGLRSFPLPKHPYPVDHRIRDGFVMSPFPALPWKLDWETNPARQQSITALPMLEQAIDRYRWNAPHFAIASSGLGRRRVPGVDFLFLYWIARVGGLIGPAA